MSKAARSRAANSEKQRAKQERELIAAKNAKVRKVTAIVTISLIGALILALIIGVGVYNHRLNSGEYLRGEVAASSKNIDVNGAMMNYYYNDVLNSFVGYYGSYVQYYGFNPSGSAKGQTISDNQTWFDYFMSGAESNVTGYLALNEAAMAEGIGLSDAEREALENRVSRIDTGLYGRGVNSGDILDAKLIEALAFKYQSSKQKEFEPSDAEINARYKENPRKYQSVGYIEYSFDWSDGGMSRNDAVAASERLAAAKSQEAFKSIIGELLRSGSSDLSDDSVESYIESFTKSGQLFSEGSELSEWAFSAKVGETKIITDESNSTTTVYMLTSEAARDEGRTVNVRHILFTADSYGSTEKARAKAEEVFAEFESGDKTPESFGVLALAWTEDENTCYNGGLYAELAGGITITNFNDWCFFGARESGDCEIIETTNGIHIVYFESEGRTNWAASVANDIVTDRFTELDTGLLSEYPVSFDDILIAQIPG